MFTAQPLDLPVSPDVEELEENQYAITYRTDDDGSIKNVFFHFKTSEEIHCFRLDDLTAEQVKDGFLIKSLQEVIRRVNNEFGISLSYS